MIAAMSMFSTLRREINAVRERDLIVVQIRVTEDAIPGSVTTTMIAPERLRLLALTIVAQPFEFEPGDMGAIADPEAQERWREIVMHPEDWRDLLIDPETRGALAQHGEPTSVFGISVVHS